jgi:hypothetical protein
METEERKSLSAGDGVQPTKMHLALQLRYSDFYMTALKVKVLCRENDSAYRNTSYTADRVSFTPKRYMSLMGTTFINEIAVQHKPERRQLTLLLVFGFILFCDSWTSNWI